MRIIQVRLALETQQPTLPIFKQERPAASAAFMNGNLLLGDPNSLEPRSRIVYRCAKVADKGHRVFVATAFAGKTTDIA
jgi:hypothetical protein